jgi:hypothetical protein
MSDILYKCQKHGELLAGQTIKAGIEKSGKQRWRCKECMKHLHHQNYLRNKERIDRKNAVYKEKNPEKFTELNREWYRKSAPLNRDKLRARYKKYRKENSEKASARQKRFKSRAVRELDDVYVKQTLCARSSLRHEDIPQELVDLKRAQMLFRRQIKLSIDNKAIKDLEKQLNELENKNNG